MKDQSQGAEKVGEEKGGCSCCTWRGWLAGDDVGARPAAYEGEDERVGDNFGKGVGGGGSGPGADGEAGGEGADFEGVGAGEVVCCLGSEGVEQFLRKVR